MYLELGEIVHVMKAFKVNMGYHRTKIKTLLILEAEHKVVLKPKPQSQEHQKRVVCRLPQTQQDVAAFNLGSILIFLLCLEKSLICTLRSTLLPFSSY